MAVSKHMESGGEFKRKCIATEGIIPLSEIYGFQGKVGAEEFYTSADLADSEDTFDVELTNNRIVRRMQLN